MANPFEENSDLFVVLINDEGQHSIWPDGFQIPQGWEKVLDAKAKQKCLEYVESCWTDMRPKSLVAQMNQKET